MTQSGLSQYHVMSSGLVECCLSNNVYRLGSRLKSFSAIAISLFLVACVSVDLDGQDCAVYTIAQEPTIGLVRVIGNLEADLRVQLPEDERELPMCWYQEQDGRLRAEYYSNEWTGRAFHFDWDGRVWIYDGEGQDFVIMTGGR